jgi:hypothetical protein
MSLMSLFEIYLTLNPGHIKGLNRGLTTPTNGLGMLRFVDARISHCVKDDL